MCHKARKSTLNQKIQPKSNFFGQKAEKTWAPIMSKLMDMFLLQFVHCKRNSYIN